MVKPGHKSRSLRRVKRKTPGGRTVTQFKKRKPNAAKCVDCGQPLKGVIRERPCKMHNSSKTKKRPERPYGGNLCSKCMRKKIIEKTRAE